MLEPTGRTEEVDLERLKKRRKRKKRIGCHGLGTPLQGLIGEVIKPETYTPAVNTLLKSSFEHLKGG